MNTDSKIYVAGHRGLVGSAILDNLAQNGYKNTVTRTHGQLDLTDAHATKAFFETERPEYVFLAAAKVGGIVANNLYRGEFIYENLMIQNNVVHQSYLHGVKKLLFLGSTCIYPKVCPQPMKEEYLLTDVLEYTNEPYAIAKIAGIKLCESYNLQYGTNFISVMPTNLYGPNDNFDLERSHVLPALIRKIHLGKALERNDWETIYKDLNHLPIEGISQADGNVAILEKLERFGIKRLEENKVVIEIWGSGTPMREFLWSEDMAAACVFLMEHINFKDTHGEGEKQIRNTHINIGTGKDISIGELVQLIKAHIGFRGSFRYNTEKPDGTLKKLTDVSKLNALGWKHKMALQQGISALYALYLNE